MKPLRKILLASLGILPFLGPTDIALAENKGDSGELLSSVQEVPWRKSRFIVEAQSGSRSVATLDAMIPFMGDDDFMIYTNLMAKMGTGANNANGNAFEGNIGFGFRRVNDDENAIYGAYAYFDILKSVNDNQFTQVTIGAERLGLTWDFRANAYLPVGTQEYTKDIYTGGKLVISEHNLIEYIKSRTEKVSAGGDIEVGRTIGSDKLRAYLAAYSFGQDLTGPRARLEYQMNDHFIFTASAQHDKERGTQYFLGARFLLGGAKTTKSNSIYSRMTDMVIRDVDIVTKTTDVDVTRVEFDRFYLVDLDSGPGGDGTGEDPFGYIDEAIEAAPDNAIIFIKGEDGSINRVKDNVQLKTGQILWGGEKALYWNFDTGQPVFSAGNETLLVHDGEGVRQTIGGSIHANDNTGIYNLDITADGNDTSGIIIDNKHNVTISAVNISGFKGSSESNPYAGIYVSGDNASVTIDDINISNSDVGVLVTGGQVSFANLTIKNSTYQGMNIKNATVTTKDLTITDSGLQGLYLENASFTADNINISTSGADGIYQNGGSLTVTDTITVTGSAKDGMHLEDTDLKANSLNITNSGDYGLYHNGGKSLINNNVIVSDSGKDGIHLENINLNADSVDVQHSGGRGIYHEGGVFTVDGPLSVYGSSLAGIWGNNTDFDITGNVTIDQSDSTEGHGLDLSGGSFSAHAVTVSNSKDNGLNLKDTSFTANTLDVTGSGKKGVWGSNTNFDLTADVIIDQSDSVEGNGLELIGGSFSAHDVTVSNSKDNGLNLKDTSFTANTLDVTGSGKKGVWGSNTNFDLTADVIIDQSDSVEGNGLELIGGSFSAHDVTVSNSKDNGLNLKDTSFTANTLDLTGSGKKGVWGSNTNFDLTADVIIDQSDSVEGNGLELIGGSFSAHDVTVSNSKDNGLNLKDTLFTANTLDVTGSGKKGVWGSNTNFDLTSNVTIDQRASTEGHGLELIGGSFSAHDVTVSNSKDNGLNLIDTSFTANSLDVTGSGKEGVWGSNANFDLTGDVTIDQSASTEGHGLDLTGGSLSASNVTVSNSKGNGVNLKDMTATITGSLTSNNNELDGVYIENTILTTANVTANNNKSNGIYIRDDSSATFLESVTANDNLGVGLFNHRANTIANNVNINNNHIGILNGGGSVTIEGGTISNNSGNGIQSSYGTLTADNIVISDSGENGILVEGDTYLELHNSTISLSKEHGLYLKSGTVIITDATFTNNGVPEAAADADDISKLFSAIKVGSKFLVGTFNATNLTVANNAAGIELVNGAIKISGEGATRSTIDNNFGYGLWIHDENGTLADKNRTTRISNTDISNTKKLDSVEVSGHGIYAQNSDFLELIDVNIDNNEGNGLWIQSGKLDGSLVTISSSGHEYSGFDKESSTYDYLTYGMRVDEIDTSHPTIVNLNDLTTTNSVYFGLLVNGGEVTLAYFNSIANQDGLVLTNGTVTLTDALISENHRFGIRLRNYTYETNSGTRKLDIINSEISKTENNDPENNYGRGTGYGITVEHDSIVNVMNTKVIDNEGFGLYLKIGTVTIDGEMSGEDHNDANNYKSVIANNDKAGLWADTESGEDQQLSLTIKNTLISGNGYQTAHDEYKKSSEVSGLLISPTTQYFYADGLLITGNKRGMIIATSSGRLSKIENSFSRNNDELGYIRGSVTQANNNFADMLS